MRNQNVKYFEESKMQRETARTRRESSAVSFTPTSVAVVLGGKDLTRIKPDG